MTQKPCTLSVVKPGFNGATAWKPWKTAGINAVVDARNELQWGHGLEAVEDTPRCRPPLARWSMLQWGLGLEAVEDAVTEYCRTHEITLQWGHGLEAVEDKQALTSAGDFNGASMGPRLGSRGRPN